MMKRSHWFVEILLVMFLVSCAINSSQIFKTPRQQTVTEAALAGAAGGTALGAILGYWVYDDPVTGGIIGGIAGFLVGVDYGEHVANQREYYKTRSAYLDDCIRETLKMNHQLQQYSISIQEELRGLDNESKQILSLYNQKKVRKAELTAQQQQFQAKLETVITAMERASIEVLIEKEVLRRAQQEYTQIHELYTLTAHVEELEQEIEKLYDDLQSMFSS